MSSNMMFLIAVLYLGAALSFAIELRWIWCGIALCWGVGNALIGVLSLDH